MDFWAKLAHLGWSEGYFAEQAGVSRALVSKWRVQRRVPPWADWGLGLVIRLREVSEISDGTWQPKGRPRGVPIQQVLSGEYQKPRGVFEVSAAQAATQVVGDDYVEKLKRWEEADLDQDGEEWGRG